MEDSQKRANWSGHLGFVLAAAASAVGLGNLWRFPASAASYGGGIFLCIYFLLFLSFGVFMMITEIAIGRATRLSAIKAFSSLNGKWAVTGWLGTLVPILILPYYCVIGGWVTEYFFRYLVSPGLPASEGFFSSFTSNTGEVFMMFAVFTIPAFAFIFAGVKRGIETSNRVLMPMLLALTVGIAAFTVTRPGATEGLKYLLVPNFSCLFVDGSFSFSMLSKIVLAAMGQMFFSLSIAMGILITYGSYMPKKSDITRSSLKIGLIDTLVAVLAGLIIIPPAYTYGGEELARTAGIKLMFVSLPQVFSAMPAGHIVAVAFFALCLFAALTSAVSMAETVVASVCDLTKLSRASATTLTVGYVAIAAVPSAMSIDFLGKTDFVTNSVLMPVCAFLTCIFVGWVAGTEFIRREATAEGVRFRAYPAYRIVMRYFAPLMILLILAACLGLI